MLFIQHAESLNAQTNVRKVFLKNIYTPGGWAFEMHGGYVWECDGMCGLERKRERGRQREIWGVGSGWVRLPSRLHADDRSSSQRLHGLALERLHVVQ